MLLLLFSSIILLIQACIHASQLSGDASLNYAVAVSAISIGITVIFIAYAKFKTDAFMTITFNVRGNAVTIAQAYGIFMFIWTGIGAFVLTFYKPYSVPSNAYVACWLCFISAALYTAATHSRVESAFRSFSDVSLTPSLSAIGGCMFAAAIVFFVSLGYLNFWAGALALPHHPPTHATLSMLALP